MTNLLVTGGAGFIGTNLVQYLVRHGYRVKVLDNFSTGRRDNLAGVEEQIEIIEGDVRDMEIVRQACQKVDYVFHHAAWRAVGRSVDDPAMAHEHNLTGTLNLLMAAREAKVRRVVLASSSAVYGDQSVDVFDEDMLPRPESPYAVAKLATEHYGWVFSKLYGLDTVALRYFNVYGSYCRPESIYSLVVPIFTDCLLASRSAEVHGDGEQRRDFVHVDDVIRANMAAVTRPEKFSGMAINIGSGATESVMGILNILQDIFETNLKPVYGAKREGDVLKTRASVEKAKHELGWQSKVSLQDGLIGFVRWYRETMGVKSKIR